MQKETNVKVFEYTSKGPDLKVFGKCVDCA